jgi:hypothetical protein
MLQQKMEQKISCVWTFWLLNVHTYIHIYNIYIYMYMDVTIAEQNMYVCIIIHVLRPDTSFCVTCAMTHRFPT